MNMVEELGISYFAQRFGGSFIKGPKGEVCCIRSSGGWVDDKTVPVNVYKGRLEKLTASVEMLPADHFTDMSVLAVPRLGWRSAARGKFLAHYSRNNTSYQRGVCPGNLKVTQAPHTRYLSDYGEISLAFYQSESVQGKLILEPNYLSLAEGLQRMREGKLLAFPVNASFAVTPHDEENYALLASDRVVGTVAKETGEINLTIPFDPAMLESV